MPVLTNATKAIRCTAMLLGTTLLATSQFITPVYAKTTEKIGVAIVTGSNLRLRSSSSLSGKTLDYAEKDDIVVVIDKVNSWYHVLYNNQEGYMSAQYLQFLSRENVELGYGKVSGDVVNIRSAPNTNSTIVTRVTPTDKPYIIGINDGWYKVVVHEKVGYIRSDYLELTEIPYENADSDKEPLFIRDGKYFKPLNTTILTPVAPEPPEAPPKEEIKEDIPVEGLAQSVLNEAVKHLGVPYVWGGKSPNTGFDCSGFVYYVFNTCGYPLSRDMVTQYNTGINISKNDLQPGDLVFFQGTYKTGVSHVGIYVGNGQFIHAPSSGKTVSYADLNSAYYVAHWYGACRISR